MQREVNLECSNKERTKMKVQKTQEKVFTPIQLNLTFETQEEYEVFHTMLRWNATIPSTVYARDEPKHNILKDVMNNIAETML